MGTCGDAMLWGIFTWDVGVSGSGRWFERNWSHAWANMVAGGGGGRWRWEVSLWEGGRVEVGERREGVDIYDRRVGFDSLRDVYVFVDNLF